MSNTKREPLLSDEFMENHADKWNEGVRGITIQHRTCLLQGADWAREHYESARAKDAELIQQLVDEVSEWMQPNLDERFRGEQWHESKRILDDAAAAGFKPSEP